MLLNHLTYAKEHKISGVAGGFNALALGKSEKEESFQKYSMLFIVNGK